MKYEFSIRFVLHVYFQKLLIFTEVAKFLCVKFTLLMKCIKDIFI